MYQIKSPSDAEAFYLEGQEGLDLSAQKKNTFATETLSGLKGGKCSLNISVLVLLDLANQKKPITGMDFFDWRATVHAIATFFRCFSV